MTATAAAATTRAGLLEAYERHQRLLGGSPAHRRDRVAAARRFLAVHPDLDVWMARPLDGRLAELRRRKAVWPLVGFAILTGRCRPDAELLFAKSFGHTMARWTAGLFPEDLARLAEATDRLELGDKAAAGLLRQALPMVVAFAGHPPSQLTSQHLDAFDAAADTTQQRLAPAGAAKTVCARSVRPPSRTRSSPCEPSSTTSPPGGGPSHRRDGWCSPPTSPTNPSCCPVRCRLTSTRR